jgi:UDP-glucose 4-epimerase
MRVLVTGAHGYIGGRLLLALAGDSNMAVTAGSRMWRQTPAGVTNIVIDWSDVRSLQAACKNQDAIVHLAAMNEHDCERDPAAALRCNGQYTADLLRVAESSGVRRFVYVSTSKVFGASPEGAIDEASLPRPANHYAITHRLAEDYVLAAHDRRRIEAAVLRLSNAVGHPADPNINVWMLIANDLCRQAATNTRIVLKTSGRAWRNFIAMADVVAAARHALSIPVAMLDNGLFHIGSPKSVRIYDLAEQIAGRAERLYGHSVKISHAAPSVSEAHVQLDWCTAKFTATNWIVNQSLDAEIDATLRLCRDKIRQL